MPRCFIQHTPPTNTICNTLQHAAKRCNTLQHAATRCNTLQRTATHCNTLQHPATPCNTLQHPATPRNTLQHWRFPHSFMPTCTSLSRARTRARALSLSLPLSLFSLPLSLSVCCSFRIWRVLYVPSSKLAHGLTLYGIYVQGLVLISDAGLLVGVYRCGKGCHVECLKALVDVVPNGSWNCAACTARQVPQMKVLLQHTAIYCNTLQHTATHCNTPQRTHNMPHFDIPTIPLSNLLYTRIHCTTLQHGATHCNILQNTATHYKTLQDTAKHL